MKTGNSAFRLSSCLKVACLLFVSAVSVIGQQIHLPTLDISMTFESGVVVERSFDPSGLETVMMFDLEKMFFDRMRSDMYDADLQSFDFRDFIVKIERPQNLPATCRIEVAFAWSYCDTPQVEYLMATTTAPVAMALFTGNGQSATDQDGFLWQPGIDGLEQCVQTVRADKVFLNVWARVYDENGTPVELGAFGVENMEIGFTLKAFVRLNVKL